MATTNHYLVLIHYMLNANNRKKIQAILPSLYIASPYDIIIKELLMLKHDITIDELVMLINDKVDAGIIRQLIKPITVSEKLISITCNNLMALNTLDKIAKVMHSNVNAIHKVDKISRLISANKFVSEPKAKLSTLLNDTTLTSDYEFIYPVRRGEFVCVAGYTGIGKTRLTLSLIREAVNTYGLKALYIPIEDWSEVTLRQVIMQAPSFPEFYVSIYSDCQLQDIECEIDYTTPDIVFIDSLTEIQSPVDYGDKRYLTFDYVGKQLKVIAQKYNCIIIATHQLTYTSDYPTADDLQDAKSHLLKHTDLCLGIGGDIDDNMRYITTIKVRHHPTKPTIAIRIDYRNLTYKIVKEVKEI